MPLRVVLEGEGMGRSERAPGMRSKGGFTLIELMIVVAIVGVLAAIAIPAYRNYVDRAKMSEVLAALDAISQGASEYHAVLSFFPRSTYGASNLASFSEEYATITLVDSGNRYVAISIRANFTTLDLAKYDNTTNGQLDMVVTYDNTTDTGYSKRWDLSSSTIDAIYLPK